MSGGYFDYNYVIIEETYGGKMEDVELNEMIEDLAQLLKDLEWYKSADSSQEVYKESVIKFKKKWFKRNKIKVKELVDKKLDEVKNELMESLRYMNE